jgi:hypothetical protein
MGRKDIELAGGGAGQLEKLEKPAGPHAKTGHGAYLRDPEEQKLKTEFIPTFVGRRGYGS